MCRYIENKGEKSFRRSYRRKHECMVENIRNVRVRNENVGQHIFIFPFLFVLYAEIFIQGRVAFCEKLALKFYGTLSEKTGRQSVASLKFSSTSEGFHQLRK